MSVKENPTERQVLRNLHIEVDLLKHKVLLHSKLAFLIWPSLVYYLWLRIHNLKEVVNHYENLFKRILSTRKTNVCVWRERVMYTFFVNQADQKLPRIGALNKGIQYQKRYKFTPRPGCPEEAMS